jgi:hypothetical protein
LRIFDPEYRIACLEKIIVLKHVRLLNPKPSAVGRFLIFAVTVLEDPFVINKVYSTLQTRKSSLLEANFTLLGSTYKDWHIILRELVLPSDSRLRKKRRVIFTQNVFNEVNANRLSCVVLA